MSHCEYDLIGEGLRIWKKSERRSNVSLLDIKNLCIWYENEDHRQVVSDLSFQIQKGELGLVGPSGCGEGRCNAWDYGALC